MVSAIGIVRKPKTGDDISTWCGRCKCDREHVITALKPDGSVERVQCRTCDSLHLFRSPRSASASTRARSTREKAAPVEVESGPVREYSMQARFSVGDRITHPKFGLGTVVEKRIGKIDVKFGREIRVLVHAG